MMLLHFEVRETSRDLPVFEDEALCVPHVLHSHTCRARLSESGKRVHPSRRCSCRSTDRFLPKGTVVRVAMEEEFSSLVEPVSGHLGFSFIERGGLVPVRPDDHRAVVAPALNSKGAPADILLVDQKLLEGPLPKAILDRKRKPRGGELVVFRADPKVEVWRYLMTVQGELVLVDPWTPYDRVLKSSFRQHRRVRCEGPIEKNLAVLLPWPTGETASFRGPMHSRFE